jgi:hypothetical protein
MMTLISNIRRASSSTIPGAVASLIPVSVEKNAWFRNDGRLRKPDLTSTQKSYMLEKVF